MKSTFLKKLAVLAGTFAVTAVTLVASPVTTAFALDRPNVNFGLNLWGGGSSAATNSTGIFDVPPVGTSITFGFGSTVTTGTVKVGDVLTQTTMLVNNATNAGVWANLWTGQASKTDLLVERTNGAYANAYNWNFPTNTAQTRTHTITATDIAHGWFDGGVYKSNISVTDPNENYYSNESGWVNYSLVRPTDIAKLKVTSVWKLNGTVVPATENFNLNTNITFSNGPEGTDIDATEATYLTGGSGSSLNSGGCVDTTGLAVGDVLELDYALTVDGAKPEINSQYVNSANGSLTWQTSTDPNPAQGTFGTATLPLDIYVSSYKFVSSTVAEFTSYSISSSSYNVGDKIKFRSGTLPTLFPEAEYTISAINKANNTIQITGSGWTPGSAVYNPLSYIIPSLGTDKTTYSLVLTQTMIDGYIAATNKTNLLGVWIYQNGIIMKAGKWVFNVKAHKKGETLNRVVACDGEDVVNLKATKEADGDTYITFQEPTGSKYSASTRHYCQLKAVGGGTVPIGTWIGGVPAMEVTPATSPRTFSCTVGSLQSGGSYQLAIYNFIGNGWMSQGQTTWVTFKNAPDVSTDATLTSAGIGTATEGVTFDPATLSYSVTSTDITTPYPNVVTSNSKSTYIVKLNGTTVAKPNNLNLVTGTNTVTIEVTSPSGAKKTYTFTIKKVDVAADATLSSLSFGDEALTPAFSSSTTTYNTTVSSTTTTYPFPSYAAAQNTSTVVVKNGGVEVTGTDPLSLVDGLNVVTVEVTAPNGTSKKTYTLNITKQVSGKDPNLSALPVIDGVTSSPSFDAEVTSYTGSVTESTTSVTVSGGATTSINGATTVYKLNGVVVTLPGDLKLRPGANKLETIVTSSDGTTTKTYTQTITRAVLEAGSSTGENDARMAVNPVPGASYVDANGQTVEGFDSELSYEPNVYTKNVPVNQTDVTLLTGGAANSGATIVNEYSTDGGLTWTAVVAPNKVPLAAGKTTKIRTTVTKGTDTKVYMTDVVRPAIDPTADVGPVEGDGDTAPKSFGSSSKFTSTNDSSFQLSWNKASGKLVSQATGVYIGYIEAKITFTKGAKTYTCSAQFGTIKALPMKTAAQKTAAMKMKTFTGKQFCIDKTKMDPKSTAPTGGLTTANFKKIKTMNKTAAELTQEKAALAALKGFTGLVQIQVTRYRAWPTTMVNLGEHNSKGGKISVQIRNTKVTLN